jgi:hypothetical protein
MINLSTSRGWLLALCASLGGCAGGSDDSSGGECDLLTGDLVITEIMANPAGPDDGQEYFEIYNASAAAVDLAGVTLRYAKADGSGEKTHVMNEIVVEAGDYLVVGDVVPELKPNHVDYGYGNDLGAMLNGGAVLSVGCGSEIIDEVEYPSMEESRFDGVSFGVDGNVAPDHLLNDDIENFCPATAEFATGMFGSPGEANEVCNVVTPGTCSDGGTDRAVNPPVEGDLIISEFMPNPAGTDGDQEWFEVYAAREVDLNGLVAGQEAGSPKINVDAAECVTIGADEYFIFAKKDDVGINGGLPAPVDTFTFALTDAGTLFIGIGDTVLDTVAWTDAANDKASSLDPGALDPAANDNEASWCPAVDEYGDAGNFGTPGMANPACPVECGPDQCADGDGCRDIDPPTAGQVRITEVMPNPEGSEPGREWFEISALADFDLAALQIGKDGTLTAMLATAGSCGAVGNGDVVVVAHTGNDDLPAFDYPTSVGLSNSDTNSTVVGAGDVVLDTFTYACTSPCGTFTASEGKSRQLDPDGTTICLTPSTSPYTSGATTCGGTNGDPTAGNCGTPGEANPECP